MNSEFENNDPLNSPDFGLPEGYFQKSAGSVFNKIEWLEEHKQFPHLEAFKKTNAFAVPDHYFDKSEQRLELTDYPVLKVLSKEKGFITPADYFEEAEGLQLAAFGDATPLYLQSIPKQNNFGLPAGYFSENAGYLAKTLLKKEAKTIGLFNRRSWMAVAALLVIGLGFWLYNSYAVPIVEDKDCGTIACIDKADLLKANNLESLENDELYELVNTEALEQKLGEEQANKNKKSDSLTDDDDLPDEL